MVVVESEDWHSGEVKVDFTGDSAIAVSHAEVTYSASLHSASYRGSVSHDGSTWSWREARGGRW